MNWLTFLRTHHIEHVTEGKNVQRGNVNVRCPFCADDPDFHLGIHLEKKAWACWRNTDHRGRSPLRLVKALLRCTHAEAVALCGEEAPPPSTFDEMRKKLEPPPPEEVKRFDCSMPPEFLPLDHPLAAPGKRYLEDRGFIHAENLTLLYDVRYAARGDYCNRVIFPFYYRHKLYGWTSRAVGKARLRYVSFFSCEDARVGLLYLDRSVIQGRRLVVVEGPVDALKVDYYCADTGVRATALLGLAINDPRKVRRLLDAAVGFDEVLVALDPGAEATAMRVCDAMRVAQVPVRLVQLPGSVDPGDLSPDDLQQLFT
jgi:hypothetical protein